MRHTSQLSGHGLYPDLSVIIPGGRTISFADPADKARHDRMVALVTQMLDLNKRLQDAKLEHEKTLLQRQIEATDAAIDTSDPF
jgi:hypothetical protein